VRAQWNAALRAYAPRAQDAFVMQSVIYASTRSRADFADLFGRRIEYWNVGNCSTLPADIVIDTLTKRLQLLFASLHYTVAMASIRTVCNAWNTAARFHSEPKPCCFCGLPGGDDVVHFASCPDVISVFDGSFDEVLTLNAKDELALFLGLPPFLEDHAILVHGICISAFLATHQSIGGCFRSQAHSRGILCACLRALSRKDLRCRNIVVTKMSRLLEPPPEIVIID
jgi:hypothetical protein